MDAKFDIFRKLPDGQPVWLKAVVGLDNAKSELARMARVCPGDYFLYDTSIGSVISSDTKNTRPFRQCGFESTLCPE